MGLRELDYSQCYLDLGNRIAKKVDTKHSEIWLSKFGASQFECIAAVYPFIIRSHKHPNKRYERAESNIFFFCPFFIFAQFRGLQHEQ